MSIRYQLEPLKPSDYSQVRDVYVNAIESLACFLYTEEQIQAWTSLACLPGVLDESLEHGAGWVSLELDSIVAFAVRYPSNRLALLYCRGCAARRGHATALLDRLELEAYQEGEMSLFTEASLLSYLLLIKRGWTIRKPETIQIGGVNFDRFLMQKDLNGVSIR